MSFKQPPELHELQADTLGESIQNNSYLPKSPLATKNKGLNTVKQFVTGAINELLIMVTSIKATVVTSLGQQQEVIGDFTANPSLVTDLKKIDASVLHALVKIYKDMAGDLNNPKDISTVAPSIKEAILKLSKELESEKRFSDFKEEYLTSGAAPMHSFLLTYKPIESTIKLKVNGIEYGHNYDPTTRLVRWIFTKANGGFDLTKGFAVKITYDYLYAENNGG
jgi:hypothetical protein